VPNVFVYLIAYPDCGRVARDPGITPQGLQCGNALRWPVEV